MGFIAELIINIFQYVIMLGVAAGGVVVGKLVRDAHDEKKSQEK